MRNRQVGIAKGSMLIVHVENPPTPSDIEQYARDESMAHNNSVIIAVMHGTATADDLVAESDTIMSTADKYDADIQVIPRDVWDGNTCRAGRNICSVAPHHISAKRPD